MGGGGGGGGGHGGGYSSLASLPMIINSSKDHQLNRKPSFFISNGWPHRKFEMFGINRTCS